MSVPRALVFFLAALLPAFAFEDDAAKLKIKGLREYAKQGSAAIGKIAPYLEDPDVDVRREAVKALVLVGTQRSLEPLTAACSNNDSEVQIRATDGLVNFYLPGYVEHGLSASLKRAGEAISGRWTDNNDDAVEPDTPLRPEIVKALSDLVSGGASLEARANAARALGILRAKTAVPVLCDSLRSKDSRVMYEALVALQKIRDRAAGPKVAFFVRDMDERVKIAAIETSGLLGATDAAPEIRRVLDGKPTKKVRRAALVALAQIPDPANRPLFLSLMQDKDDDARAAAAEGLGRLANPEDRAQLDRAWADEKKTSPRLSLAFALALHGNIDSSNFGPIGFLVNTLTQRSWRGIAQPYLNELALKPTPRKAIIEAVDRALTKDEKSGIATALGSSASKDALPALERLSKDDDPAVSREALRALRILHATAR